MFVRVLIVTIVTTWSRDFLTCAKRVQTTNGDIDGISDVIDGVTVDIYLGIPFAQPPLGDLRFRAPRPLNWTGVLIADTQPNSCMQSPDTMFGRFSGVEMWNTKTNISEDCLYINLYVPKTLNKSLPTLIWIYGGSFVYGSSTLDIYDGRYLAAKQNVIVAAMQYRMSVHGFLYFGSDGAPGNMGLLDQQLAIKWVYDNVEQFGGDRGKVTLMGESAGSASISYHLFAPTSWPYFSGGIMLSATSLYNNWAIVEPEDLLEKSRTFAKLMNCDNQDTVEIIKCLQRVDASELENRQWELENGNVGTFNPTIDGYFLKDHPKKLAKIGRMKDADILLGNTKDEGEFFLVYFYTDIFLPENLWERTSLDRTQFLNLTCRIGECESDFERDALLYVYEQSVLPNNRGSYWDILDDILGDYYFKCGVRGLAQTYSDHSRGNTYLYSFDYRHGGVTWPDYMGALHGYEIELIFGQPFNPSTTISYNDLDRNVSLSIMNYFTHFANYGNLNAYQAEWPRFTSGGEEHIVFNQDGSTHAQNGYRTKQCAFWTELRPLLKSDFSKGVNHKGEVSGAFSINISFIVLCIVYTTSSSLWMLL